MKKIKIDNVLRIIDVHHTQLSPETLAFLKAASETCTDRVLNEHIYNISDLFDEYRDQDFEQDVLNELETLIGLQNKKNAGYTRIVYS